MADLNVRMFGRFHVMRGSQALEGLDACKAQELFGYVLLHRNTGHSREALASLLWADCSTAQSKKYLRQSLWQLQAALNDSDAASAGDRVLLVGPDWLQLNPRASLWLDVAVFEQAFALTRGVVGHEISIGTIQAIHHAVELYTGHLLQGWYKEWCVYERERFQNMYLAMLDKLMDYCEKYNQYEMGLAYGVSVLQHDCARERTHRQMMRLYYLAGDRTAALRQYQRCVEALEEDLGIEPERQTVMAYEQIRAGHLESSARPPEQGQHGLSSTTNALEKVLNLVSQLQDMLVEIQQAVFTFRPPDLSLNEGGDEQL